MTNSVVLHRYLDDTLITLKHAVSSPKKLHQELAALLSKKIGSNKEKVIYHCLLEREKLGNTGIGNGVALPHSRCEFINNAVIAIITLDKPINYDSLDKQPVDVAFGLLVPQEANDEHLQILAEIAHFMSQQSNKKQLLNASTPEQVIELIKNWQT